MDLKWIYNSELYNTMLDEYDKDCIVFDEWRLFEFPNIITCNNINRILENIRYFGITDEKYLYPCFVYIAELDIHGVDIIKKKFPELKELHDVQNINSCYSSVQNNNLFSLRYAHEHGGYLHGIIMYIAAGNNDIRCLKYLHEQGYGFTREVFNSATVSNSLNCLKYLYDNKCPFNNNILYQEDFKIETLMFLRKIGCKYNKELPSLAVKYDDYEILKYIIEDGCKYKNDLCDIALVNGNYEMLEYTYNLGCRFTYYSCIYAAFGGCVECLKFVHEHGTDLSPDVITMSYIFDRFECLKYAFEHECKPVKNILFLSDDTCVNIGNICEYCYDNKKDGHLFDAKTYYFVGCFKYLHEMGYEIKNRSILLAISDDNVNVLKYILKHISSDENMCDIAAQYGSIKCLEFLFKYKYEYSNDICDIASKYNNLKCLEFLYKHGCELDYETVTEAVKNNNLACLEFLLKNRCPYDSYVLRNEAEGHCRDFLFENGYLISYKYFNRIKWFY